MITVQWRWPLARIARRSLAHVSSSCSTSRRLGAHQNSRGWSAAAEGVPALHANGQSPNLYSECADDTSPAQPPRPLASGNLVSTVPHHAGQNSHSSSFSFTIRTFDKASLSSASLKSASSSASLESVQRRRVDSHSSLRLPPASLHALMDMALAAPQSAFHVRQLTRDQMPPSLQMSTLQMPPALAVGTAVRRNESRTPMMMGGGFSGRRALTPSASSTERVGLRSFSNGQTAFYSAYAPPSPPSSSRSSSTSSSPIDPVAAPAVTYRVAAGGSGKTKSFVPERDIYGITEYGRKRARVDTGQDSFFMAPLGVMDINTGGLAIGVADGVGGYMDSGIDSADFSHEFCEHMARLATCSSPSTLTPKALMARGYKRVQEDGIVRGGASTACVGIARPDGRLDVANLGDSGYIVFRLGKVSYTSEPQTHAFNTPFQLSIIPPDLLAQSRAYGGTPLTDTPRSSALTTHLLEPGDVVIFATDGVFDNMFPQQVLQIVGEEMVAARIWVKDSNNRYRWAEGNGDCVEKKIVERVVRAAKKLGFDQHTDGPFAKEVQRYYPHERYMGGKPDDVGVVCLIVDKGKL